MENLRGKKIYNWKGGYEPYYGENWLVQKRKARLRDKNICQRCGKTREQEKKELSVHHIIPFRNFGLKNYKKANKLNNLITLDKRCHKMVEENGWSDI